MNNKITRFKHKFVILFIAVSLCVNYYFHVMPQVLGQGFPENAQFFVAAVNGIHSPEFANLYHGLWHVRFVSFMASAEWVRLFNPHDAIEFARCFASYHATWLFATFLVCIIMLEEPLFAIFGIFSGLMYTALVFTSDANPFHVGITPWDMASLFLWTLSFLLWRNKHYRSMLAVIVLGTFLKESVALTAMLLFFTALPLKRKFIYFGLAFAGCLTIRFTITHFILGTAKTIVMDNQGGGQAWAMEMIKWELGGWPHMNSIFWAQGGLFVAIWFLPFKTLADKGILAMLILFYISMTYTNLVAKCHYEVRQWVDVLGVSVIFLQSKIYEPKTLV